jgi:hypothetical protein
MISDEKSHKRCEASGEKERVFAKGNYSYYTLFLTKFQLPILSSHPASILHTAGDGFLSTRGHAIP